LTKLIIGSFDRFINVIVPERLDMVVRERRRPGSALSFYSRFLID